MLSQEALLLLHYSALFAPAATLWALVQHEVQAAPGTWSQVTQVFPSLGRGAEHPKLTVRAR